MNAKGQLKARTMNKLEARYAQELELRQRVGEIAWWEFEPVKFRLADNTFYTPDFLLMLPDGQLEAHEVKGFWQDDARVKIKIAAEHFPVKFVAITQVRGAWQFEGF